MDVKDKIMAHLRDIKIAAKTIDIAQAVGGASELCKTR